MSIVYPGLMLKMSVPVLSLYVVVAPGTCLPKQVVSYQDDLHWRGHRDKYIPWQLHVP